MQKKIWFPIGLSLAAILLIWLLFTLLPTGDNKKDKHSDRPVPVEVAPVEQGPIELWRSFTGTLEAAAEFVVAPKVSGRIEQLSVDLADTVSRGQLVARLDNAEYVQSQRQAEANLAVARANLGEAESLLVLAERELKRVDDLRKRSVISESQVDTARADQLAKKAHVDVTRAQLNRAEAELQAARIRLGYTEVSADWRGGDEQRVVAERFVDEGQTVAANAPLLRIVELDPVKAVFFVTEKDYASLQPGQRALLATDAYGNETFAGEITRIAPVFREATRQARVELQVANPGLRLKPGMFVRVTAVLQRVDNTLIVPEPALVKRDDRYGVFQVSDDGRAVRWQPVQLGIRQGDRVQVSAEGLDGRVVVLGQQLLDEGSSIAIAGETSDSTAGSAVVAPVEARP
jgi:RND family efflux transporter MFP subunit